MASPRSHRRSLLSAVLLLAAGAFALLALQARAAGATPLGGVPCTITGTAGNDYLVGTSGDDVICGLGGNDTLKGLAGNDFLFGGDGNDNLIPGRGNDQVFGEIGTDTVNYSNISSGGVTVNLGSFTASGPVVGSDNLSSIENVIGTNQDDSITGDGGPNTLAGIGGVDTMDGGSGNDYLVPGAGDDPSVGGGGGTDYVSYANVASGGVTVNLTAQTATGAGGSDTLSSIENAIGTNQSDTLRGDAGANLLKGLSGADSLFGNDGKDTLYPDGGNDPAVNGGNGGDWVSYSDMASGGVTVNLGTGTTSGAAGTDTLSFIEKAIGTAQDDTLIGDDGPNTLNGLGGADTLQGAGGNDTLVPGTGDDPTVGGGTGGDFVSYADITGSGVTVDLGPQTATGSTAGSDTLSSIENVIGTNQADDLTGTAGDNTMYGLAGADAVAAGDGTNTVFGGDGDDDLTAGTGDDTIDGGANDTSDPGDTCLPGGGTNVLSGCETNDPPAANDDSGVGFGTDQNTSFTSTNVLANDTDPNGDTLSVTNLDTTGTIGSVTNNGDGTFDYDPSGLFDYLAVGESVNDTFDYSISDGHNSTDTATVTIAISGVNDGPSAVDDSGAGFGTNEDSSFTTGSVLGNDTDPDTSDTLSVSVLDDSATTGVVTDNGDGTFGYDPNGQFESLGVGASTTDAFGYTVSDGNGGTDTATVTIAVSGVNDAPDAVDDTSSTDEDTSKAIDPRGNDSDPDSGDTLTIQSVDTTGTTGGVTITGGGTGISYNPAGHFDSLNVGQSDSDSFTYTISDGHGGTDTATVTVTVNGVNDAPAGVADSFTGTNSALAGVTLGVSTTPSTPYVAVTGNVLGNDTDVDTAHANLTASAGSTTTNGGALSVNSAGTFTYTPAPGFTGSDTFTYTVHDNGTPDKTATATVTINVAGPRVWFVNPGGAAGNGTSASPFASLVPINTGGASDSLDGTGDVIFVYQGTGNAASAGFVLEGSQRLAGQPQGLSVTNANGTYSLVAAGGSNPTITNGAGAGLTLADGNTIQAVTVQSSSGSGMAGTTINTLTVASNVSVSGNGGAELDLNAGNGTISFAAPISNGSAGQAVKIINRTGGTATISGAVTDTSGTGTGINLDNNDNSTVAFTGGVALSTGSNPALTAVNGGAVSVDNTSVVNTLATTTATALNVANTNIASPGLKFRSISVTGNGTTPTSGVILNNTGASAGLTITGNGSTCTFASQTCTGGRITGTSGDGISLTSTASPSFSLVRVDTNKGNGMMASGVGGLAISDGIFVANSDDISTNNEANLRMFNMTGTNTITNGVFRDAVVNNVYWTPTSGTGTFTVTGSTFGPNSPTTGGSGFLLTPSSSAVANLSITGGTFTGNRGDSLRPAYSGASSGTVSVSGTQFTDSNSGTNFSVDSDADLTYSVTGSTFLRHASHAVQMIVNSNTTSNSDVHGTVATNTIGDSTADSGSRDANGISFDLEGNAHIILSVTGNTIKHTDTQGTFIQSRLGSPIVDLTYRNNTVSNIDDNSPFPFFFQYGTQLEARNTSTMCLDIASNQSTGVGGAEGFRVRQRDTATFKLERLTGSGTDDTNVATFIAGQNTAPNNTTSVTHATTFTAVADGTCLSP